MAKRDYSLKTEKLIDRMCRYVEREDFTLDKKKAQEAILKTYDLFDLKRPKKVVWCIDVFDKKFESSAWSAGSAWSARSAGSAGSAWSAWSAGSAWSARSARSARSAGSAWSAWSARSAGWTALDDDFWYFVFEFEYCENPDKEYKPNENDKKYLQYSNLLLEALEYGAGYRVEWEDTLYIVPTPLVKIDAENRYHSEDKPAIQWKDGHKFYFYHGVSIPEEWILNPEKLEKKDWLEENNLEKRRIIQELMGPTFPEKIGSELIAKPSKEFKNKHNLFGLYEVKLPNDPEHIAHYVRVKDHSSNREYYLRVDPKIKDADEALAWSFGKTKETYVPLQET